MSQSKPFNIQNPRVLLTSPASSEAEQFIETLSRQRIQVTHIPLIQTRPLPCALPSFEKTPDWLFFTSKNAIHAFCSVHKALCHSTLIAVIGEATATTLRSAGFKPDFISPKFNARDAALSFVQQHPLLREHASNAHILWPCGNLARPDLKDMLTQNGWQVTPLVVYETQLATAQSLRERLTQELLNDSQYSAIVFTSPSAVAAYNAVWKEMNAVPFANFGNTNSNPMVISIGSKTTKALRDSGFSEQILQPEQSHFPALANILIELLT